MAQILPGIDHLIVAMLENRSLDNMLGALYDGTAPSLILPSGSTHTGAIPDAGRAPYGQAGSLSSHHKYRSDASPLHRDTLFLLPWRAQDPWIR
jgi:phospholipase C